MEEEQIYYKAYKFRLLPTEEQKILLAKHFGCVRVVWNHFLKEKQEHYLKNKETLNLGKCSSALTSLKKQKEYEWLNEVNSQSLQASLKNLETAYGNFFAKRTKFPKFKKKSNTNAYICPQHIKIIKNSIQVPKFKEGIKFIKHRNIKGIIKSCTISQVPSGKYYVSILCEIPKPTQLPKTNKNIGIDLGLKDFIVTSEGNRYQNYRFYKKYEKELKKQQKNLSRKQKDSKRRNKQRIKVARIHEKITNSREDMLNKLSFRLVKSYDLIALENLNVKGMMQNHKLAKAISSVGWSQFVSKLKYKCDWYGKKLVQIDRFYPSSKTCSCCNYIKDSLDLSERSWKCPKCNTEHDRDINAARNILQQALQIEDSILSSGTDDYRRGAVGRPKKIVKSLKADSDEMSKKKIILYDLKPLA